MLNGFDDGVTVKTLNWPPKKKFNLEGCAKQKMDLAFLDLYIQAFDGRVTPYVNEPKKMDHATGNAKNRYVIRPHRVLAELGSPHSECTQLVDASLNLTSK